MTHVGSLEQDIVCVYVCVCVCAFFVCAYLCVVCVCLYGPYSHCIYTLYYLVLSTVHLSGYRHNKIKNVC